jgi:heat shock protein HspQ
MAEFNRFTDVVLKDGRSQRVYYYEEVEDEDLDAHALILEQALGYDVQEDPKSRAQSLEFLNKHFTKLAQEFIDTHPSWIGPIYPH